MTEPSMIGYNPVTRGCSYPGCGTQDTSFLDGRHGRRCVKHPPAFDPTHAAELAVIDPDAAIDYCRSEVES